MRIIGGKLKGRKFKPPSKKYPTRPTTDFTKESLFNILENTFDFNQIKIVDLFGGFGGISFEALSRGCQDVTYVEKHRACFTYVKSTAKELAIDDCLSLVNADVFKFLKKCEDKYDLIFADPPYALPKLGNIPDLVFELDLLKEEGILVLEHGNTHKFQDHPHYSKDKKYGQSILSFFH